MNLVEATLTAWVPARFPPSAGTRQLSSHKKNAIAWSVRPAKGYNPIHAFIYIYTYYYIFIPFYSKMHENQERPKLLASELHFCQPSYARPNSSDSVSRGPSVLQRFTCRTLRTKRTYDQDWHGQGRTMCREADFGFKPPKNKSNGSNGN